LRWTCTFSIHPLGSTSSPATEPGNFPIQCYSTAPPPGCLSTSALLLAPLCRASIPDAGGIGGPPRGLLFSDRSLGATGSLPLVFYSFSQFVLVTLTYNFE
jgi:hypothetical protein